MVWRRRANLWIVDGSGSPPVRRAAHRVGRAVGRANLRVQVVRRSPRAGILGPERRSPNVMTQIVVFLAKLLIGFLPAVQRFLGL